MTLKKLRELVLAYVKDGEANRFEDSLTKKGFIKRQYSPTVWIMSLDDCQIIFRKSRLKNEVHLELIQKEG